MQLAANIDVLAARLAAAETESEACRAEAQTAVQRCERLHQQLKDTQNANETCELTISRLQSQLKQVIVLSILWIIIDIDYNEYKEVRKRYDKYVL